MSRLENEDTIVMLVEKRPEESLKRRWADRAGYLIPFKGQAKFKDFLKFIHKPKRPLNNRFGQEKKSQPSIRRRIRKTQTEKDKESHHSGPQPWQLRVSEKINVVIPGQPA